MDEIDSPKTSSTAGRTGSARRWMWGAALGLLVFAIHAPSLGNGFAYDDKLARATRVDGAPNAWTSELRPLSDYFTVGYWAGLEAEGDLYRPITILTYAATNDFMGGTAADPEWEAFPHHLINVLLHVWAVLLAFQLIAQLIARWIPGSARSNGWPSLLGAAVFGCSAIHSEVVAGIVGRAELLAFCCGAQAVLLCIGAFQRAGLSRIAGLVGASLLMFLAMGSKESAVAWWPFLIVVSIALPIGIDLGAREGSPGARPVDWSKLATAIGVGLPPLIAFLVLRDAAVGDVDVTQPFVANPLYHADATTRVLSGVMLWGYGLWKCVWPFFPVCDYGPVTFELVSSFGDLRFWAALVVLGGWFATGLLFVRRHPLVFIGMACFLGFSFLTTNVPFAIGTIFAERLYFTPSLGVAIVVAWIAAQTTRQLWLVPLLIWLVASGLVAFARADDWASDAALFPRDADTNPRSVNLLDKKARFLREQDRGEEAATTWKKAIELDPHYPTAQMNYARFLAAQGAYVDAERLLLQALGAPDHRQPRRHVLRCDLSVLYYLTQRVPKGIEELRAAWREPSAFQEIADRLVEQSAERLPAEDLARIAADGDRLAAGHPAWEILHGLVAHARGDFVTAMARFERAITLRPGYPWARFELGRSMLAAGRREEAVRLLRELAADERAPESLRGAATRLLRL